MSDDAFHSYMRGIRTSIRYNAAAYGYSAMITATYGALTAIDRAPRIFELFLFVLGAAAAFAITEALGSNFFRDRVRGDQAEVVVLGSAFSFISLSGGLAGACAVGWLVDPWPSWALGSFAATSLYLLLLGVELALAERAERRQHD